MTLAVNGAPLPLAARGAVAQANPDRLASRLDPDGAAVAARGADRDRHVDLHTGMIPFPTDRAYSDTSRRPHQLGRSRRRRTLDVFTLRPLSFPAVGRLGLRQHLRHPRCSPGCRGSREKASVDPTPFDAVSHDPDRTGIWWQVRTACLQAWLPGITGKSWRWSRGQSCHRCRSNGSASRSGGNPQSWTFQAIATEVGGISGTIEQNGWLSANIQGPGVACQKIRCRCLSCYSRLGGRNQSLRCFPQKIGNARWPCCPSLGDIAQAVNEQEQGAV